MVIETAITSAVVKSATESLMKFLKSARLPQAKSEANLSRHLREIESWSSRIQIFEMAGSLDTTNQTIGLEISNAPRRFSRAFVPEEMTDEVGLLAAGRHLVLLGDPGSGKTTTVKRIVRHMLTVDAGDENLNYPVRLILRDLDADANIYSVLAECIGLKVSFIQEKRTDGSISTRHLVDGRPVESVVVDVLDRTGGLILLDGLDETDGKLRSHINSAISAMAGHLHSAQVIVTCRSGDYNVMIEGLDVLEIVPLSETQISEICGKTLSDPTGFISNMTTVPYRDLANRPLFLIYLMVIFEDRKRLPERAVDVYRRFMMLALEEWDRRRGISRRSKYSHFEVEAKMDFLALLAHCVTYEERNKSFDREKFQSFYISNCERFDLPASECALVAQEIESHTGIIIDVSSDRFEFSHLSIQEYLCAYHVVREPSSDRLSYYLKVNPAPVAIATALSSNANAWLADLLLHKDRIEDKGVKLIPLLDRIVLERPNFFISEELGFVAIFVIDSICRRQIVDPGAPLTNVLDRLMESRVWRGSFASAISRYTLDLDAFTSEGKDMVHKDKEGQSEENYRLNLLDYVVLNNRNQYRGAYHITRASKAIIPRNYFCDVVGEFRPKIFASRETGPPIELDNALYFPAPASNS